MKHKQTKRLTVGFVSENLVYILNRLKWLHEDLDGLKKHTEKLSQDQDRNWRELQIDNDMLCAEIRGMVDEAINKRIVVDVRRLLQFKKAVDKTRAQTRRKQNRKC